MEWGNSTVKDLTVVVQKLNSHQGKMLDFMENLYEQIDMLKSDVDKLKQKPESRDLNETLLTLINRHGLERVQSELVNLV